MHLAGIVLIGILVVIIGQWPYESVAVCVALLAIGEIVRKIGV
jgi:hypothetical protein